MANKDLFDGQISMFSMDDAMGFETIGITDGADEFFEEAQEKETLSEVKIKAEVGQTVPETVAVKKATLPKLKIEGVFVCMGCGKLLTKAINGEKFKATCNCCNVTYSGNN